MPGFGDLSSTSCLSALHLPQQLRFLPLGQGLEGSKKSKQSKVANEVMSSKTYLVGEAFAKGALELVARIIMVDSKVRRYQAEKYPPSQLHSQSPFLTLRISPSLPGEEAHCQRLE